MKKDNSISVRGIVVEYPTERGLITALKCSELTIKAGESVAIMGHSGCGKSTLLGLISGLAQPTRGTISVGTTTITNLSEQKRVAFRKERIGIIYQADNLLPFLTVSENIFFQLMLCSSTEQSDAKISNLLSKLGLDGLGSRMPDELSGGQKQRASIARAIVHEPSIILADEPTGALDEANALNVVEILLDIQKRLKSTLIVVTHDENVASKMNRIVRLSKTTEVGGRT